MRSGSHEPDETAGQVFISHATDDRVWADAVCRTLEESGIKCWIAPRDVAPGTDWAESIARAIAGCRLLLLIHSRFTKGSLTTIAEVREAHGCGKPLLATTVDGAGVAPSLRLFLGGVQRHDSTRPARSDRLRELVGLVMGLLNPSQLAGSRQRRVVTPGYIGPYRLVSLLGEGAFGEVWLAERREPHMQRVALKIVKAGMDTKAVIARFEQERQALAVAHQHRGQL